MASRWPSCRRASRALLHAQDGPLTQELVREPGGFGLGQVPDAARARRDDDRGVRLLLDGLRPGDPPASNGEAINLSPAARLLGQPRHGLPEGLGGAGAAGRARSRHAAAAAQRGAASCMPVSWDDGGRRDGARASRRSGETHGPQSVAFLGHRADAERGAGVPRRARRSSAWAWCTATATRASAWRPPSSPTSRRSASTRRPTRYADFEESDVLVFVGANLCIAHPIMWERVCQNRRKPEIVVIDPRKTETAVAATQHLRAAAEVAICVLFYGAREPADRARLDRPRLHRRAHQRLRGVRGGGRAVHAGGDGRGDRACPRRRSRSW